MWSDKITHFLKWSTSYKFYQGHVNFSVQLHSTKCNKKPYFTEVSIFTAPMRYLIG